MEKDKVEYIPAVNGVHYYVTKLFDRKKPSLLRAVRTPSPDGELTPNYDVLAASFYSQEEADLFKDFLIEVAKNIPRYPEELALHNHLKRTRGESP